MHHHGAEDVAGVVGREREAAGRADTLVQRDDLVPDLKSLEPTVGSVLWVVRWQVDDDRHAREGVEEVLLGVDELHLPQAPPG